MTMADMDDAELERFFRAGRASMPEPDPDLLGMVLADAYAEQLAEENTALATPAPGRRALLWHWILKAALPAGLATAALSGVWIGFAGGETLALQADELMQSDLALELVYRFPALGGLFGEI